MWGVSVVDSEQTGTVWRKSSFSESGQCVEVGLIAPSVALRDSHAPAGPVLTFGPGEWAAFLGDVRARSLGLETVPAGHMSS
jgi:Domain of unknown function (DUF397)